MNESDVFGFSLNLWLISESFQPQSASVTLYLLLKNGSIHLFCLIAILLDMAFSVKGNLGL